MCRKIFVEVLHAGRGGRLHLRVMDESAGAPFKVLGDFIRVQRRLAGLSPRQLSTATQISNPYSSQIERGLYRRSAQVLKSIAEATHLGRIPLPAGGRLDADEAPRDEGGVRVATRVDPKLTDEERAAGAGAATTARRSATTS